MKEQEKTDKPQMKFVPEGKYMLPDSRVSPELMESILQAGIARAEEDKAEALAIKLDASIFDEFDGITPLEAATSKQIANMKVFEIEKLLLNDWRNAYKVDFKLQMSDKFDLELGLDRYSVSALIYPKCLRKIIKSLCLRSSIQVRYLSNQEVVDRFENTKFWRTIAHALKQHPHDDFYMVVPNEKLN